MMMDDVGQLFWRFGHRLLSSHGESEHETEASKGTPPALEPK
jgi:hypothetical protein